MRKLLLLLLVIKISVGQVPIFVEDFNNVPAGNLPSGWYLGDGGLLIDNFSPLDMDSTWTVVNNYQGSSLNGSNFLFIIDSNLTAGFYGINYSDTIETEVINAFGFQNISLSFLTYLYLGSTSSDSAAVDVYDGNKWITLERWNSSAGFVLVGGWNANAITKTYNISQYNNPNLKVRFRFYSNGTWSWWAIDDVSIVKNPTSFVDAYLLNFVSSIPDTVCVGDSVNIQVLAGTNYSPSHSADIYAYVGNDTIVSPQVTLDFSQNSIIDVGTLVFTSPGDNEVIAYVSANGDYDYFNDTIKKKVYVIPPPNVNFSIQDTFLSAGIDTGCIKLNVDVPYDSVVWNVSPAPQVYVKIISENDTMLCLYVEPNTTVVGPIHISATIYYGKSCMFNAKDSVFSDIPQKVLESRDDFLIVRRGNKIEILSEGIKEVRVYNIYGELILESKENYIFLDGVSRGVYIINVFTETGSILVNKLVLY